MKTFEDDFNNAVLSVNTMNGKDVGLRLMYDDNSESIMIIPNENAVKLAKWILEVVND